MPSMIRWASDDVEASARGLVGLLDNVVENQFPSPTPEARAAIIVALLAVVIDVASVDNDSEVDFRADLSTACLLEISKHTTLPGLAEAVAARQILKDVHDEGVEQN